MTARLIPAATLVLFRTAADGGAEVLMTQRAAAMAFAGGALVFPGGRVDPDDRALAASALPDVPAEEAAARVAAIRETIEEVGIAVGLEPAPSAEAVGRLRHGLSTGVAFARLLDGEGLRLAPDALMPFTRWCRDAHASRAFDAIFFVAEAPPAAEARPDGSETVAALWAAPKALLDAADAGRHHLIFPTRRTLERLAPLHSIIAAREHAAAYPVATITPFVETRDGVEWLCIPEGLGYPVTAERLDRVRRG